MTSFLEQRVKYFVFINVSLKIVVLMKYGTDRQAGRQAGRPEAIRYRACALDAPLRKLRSHTLNTYNLINLYTRIIARSFLSVTLYYIIFFGVYHFVCGAGSVCLL